jgi:hypothetical protein
LFNGKFFLQIQNTRTNQFLSFFAHLIYNINTELRRQHISLISVIGDFKLATPS